MRCWRRQRLCPASSGCGSLDSGNSGSAGLGARALTRAVGVAVYGICRGAPKMAARTLRVARVAREVVFAALPGAARERDHAAEGEARGLRRLPPRALEHTGLQHLWAALCRW